MNIDNYLHKPSIIDISLVNTTATNVIKQKEVRVDVLMAASVKIAVEKKEAIYIGK